MYCKNCHAEVRKGQNYCRECGSALNLTHHTDPLDERNQSGNLPKAITAAVVIIIVLAVILCGGLLFWGLSKMQFEDNVALVQNGYLGQYTDITVQEILDSNYGMLYENEEWEGGTTDSGAEIVQVTYYNEGMEDDATTIQFTMLSEECFCITAFVDPLNPVEKPTDLLATMNYNYLLAYMTENRSVAGDIFAEMGLITRLMQISGSAVQYGASADYSGDRAKICEIDGQTSLEVSVAMLLDNYGLLDLSYYLGNDGQDHTAPTEPDETEVIPESISYISCQVDDLLNDLDQNAMRASRNYNGQYLHLTGKINSFDTDGNSFTLEGLDYDITQSSGLSYTIRCTITDDTQLGNLLNANVGDTVVISCLVTEIDEFLGYTVETISIDSIIEAEEEPPQVTEQVLPTTPPVSEPLTGTVLRSAGELKVRSGPGTEYSEVARLQGGETVTIYEQQQVGDRYWGSIGYGWVCLDYVVFGVDNSTYTDVNTNGMDAYCGNWQSNRCSLMITREGDHLYMEAYWGNSAFSTTYWQMIGEYDRNADVIYYWDGICEEHYTAEDGSTQINLRYTNGEGCIVLRDGYITWMDATERATDNCIFERLPN